jgi:hypothetical protein
MSDQFSKSEIYAPPTGEDKIKEWQERKLRERRLRGQVTQFIKQHVHGQPALLGLDSNTQYRQLSWALGTRGESILNRLPQQLFIAKQAAECSTLTHYLRAFVAAKLNVSVNNVIKTGFAPPVATICFVADTDDQLMDNRVALWRRLVEMIPTDLKNADKTNVVSAIYNKLDSISTKLGEIFDIVKRLENRGV